MWDLPGPGIEPVSPALAGGFLTTVPPGKSLSTLFFFMAKCSVLWMYHILFIYSDVDEYLSYFHFLTNMNNAFINFYVQIFEWTYVFLSFGYIPRNGIAGSYSNSMFNL